MARREFYLNAIETLRTEEWTTSGYTFIGYAVPGTLEADDTWLIKRVHVVGDVTYITFAETRDGAKDERVCNKTWAHRANYYYEEG
jgi:hypothetical protein